jgi:hypothetical protein
MRYDILKKIRSTLVADTTIHTYVGDNITVNKLPKSKIAKQITIRKIYSKSDSILPACAQDIYIEVWVQQKEVTEPYKTCVEIVEKIIDIFNRKGETLNTGDLIINQIVRTSAEVDYDESQEYWTGSIVLECTTND